MKDDPEIRDVDHDKHLQKVLRENYAYIVDNSAVEYLIENCNYTKIPDKLPFMTQYAMGFRKFSAYNQPFSEM